MKVLYAVQGTGQGHISRARAMAHALAGHPAEVTWLFSGRPREALFDMAPFGAFLHRRGLTFTTRGGCMRYTATVLDNNLQQFLRDARELDLSPYDVVVSDYEPVVCRAARLQQRRVIGIGHQYAFGPGTPRAGNSWLQEKIMAGFAPVDVPLGLHWHPYADNILPPILDLPDVDVSAQGHLLVYLPFEDQEQVTGVLNRFPDRHFVQYSPALTDGQVGNVSRRRASVASFKAHLASCSGVICNSGFELVSECLQWRKPVLAKPLNGQMEQHSNALALCQLGYASITSRIDQDSLRRWLDAPHYSPDIDYPDVAGALAAWLVDGCEPPVARLSQRLWRRPPSLRIPLPRPGRPHPATALSRLG